MAVTFDFHNTLAACDDWFAVEVRTLVADVLDWQAARNGPPVTPETRCEAQSRYRALRRAIIEHGNEQEAEACVAAVLDDMRLPMQPADIAAGVEAVMRATLPGSTPLPGAVECVRMLRAANVPLAVVSSAAYHPFLEWSLEKFGIADCFAAIITSASCGFYKTRPEIYEQAARALDVAPCQVVHVGDAPDYDVRAAQAVGMRAVWLSAADGECAPELRVHSLVGLAPLLLETFGG